MLLKVKSALDGSQRCCKVVNEAFVEHWTRLLGQNDDEEEEGIGRKGREREGERRWAELATKDAPDPESAGGRARRVTVAENWASIIVDGSWA